MGLIEWILLIASFFVVPVCYDLIKCPESFWDVFDDRETVLKLLFLSIVFTGLAWALLRG